MDNIIKHFYLILRSMCLILKYNITSVITIKSNREFLRSMTVESVSVYLVYQ